MELTFVGRIPRFLGSRTIKRLIISTICFVTQSNIHKTTIGKCTFRVQVNTEMERNAVLQGSYDSFAKQVCKRFISVDGTSIDVGANVGFWSCDMALNKTTGTVYSFEPSQRNFDALTSNIEQNKLGLRVKCFQCGLSSHEESRQLYKSSDYGSLSIHKPDVTVFSENMQCGTINLRSLDSFKQDFTSKVDFIKIDVEGYEFEVLSGAKELIFSDLPAVLFEVNAYYLVKSGVTLESILTVFPDCYNFYMLKDTRVETLNLRTLLKTTDLFDVLATPEVLSDC